MLLAWAFIMGVLVGVVLGFLRDDQLFRRMNKGLWGDNVNK